MPNMFEVKVKWTLTGQAAFEILKLNWIRQVICTQWSELEAVACVRERQSVPAAHGKTAEGSRTAAGTRPGHQPSLTGASNA